MNSRISHFNRAAHSYEMHAQVQKQMAEHLLSLLPKDFHPTSIFECGCGTGHLSLALAQRFPASTLQVTDAAERMLEEAQHKLAGLESKLIQFEKVDAENIPTLYFNKAYTLAASNALIQWFSNPLKHLQDIYALLASKGYCLIGDFLPTQFPELQEILQELDLWEKPLVGHTKADLQIKAQEAGFYWVKSEAVDFTSHYDSVEQFLKSLKQLGVARNPDSQKHLTRSKWKQLQNLYTERYTDEQGIKATWKAHFVLLQKP